MSALVVPPPALYCCSLSPYTLSFNCLLLHTGITQSGLGGLRRKCCKKVRKLVVFSSAEMGLKIKSSFMSKINLLKTRKMTFRNALVFGCLLLFCVVSFGPVLSYEDGTKEMHCVFFVCVNFTIDTHKKTETAFH